MENKNDGLHVEIIGVIDDASSLSKSLRDHGFIHVMQGKDRDGKDKEFAFVYFQKREDGSFHLPTTALRINDMRINIRVTNTYQGARLLAISETGKKPKIRVDTRDRWQERCMIGTTKGGAVIARVSRGGDVKISLLSISRKVGEGEIEELLQVGRLDVYQANIPVNNPGYVGAFINQDPELKKFSPELEEAIKSFENDRPSGPSNKLDLTEAIKRKEEKKKEEEEETKTPPEEKKIEETKTLPEVLPEPEPEKPKKPEKKTAPKKKAASGKKKDPNEKRATTQKNLKKEKAQKKADQKDVAEFVDTQGEQDGSSAEISTKLNLETLKK